MCVVAVICKYNQVERYLDKIARYRQVTWWDARKNYNVPSLQRFGYSKITLTESGNLTQNTAMGLEAAWDVTTIMLIQVEEMKGLFDQVPVSNEIDEI